MFPAYASAGEDPGTVEDSEKVFPDPSTFDYDDVEVNFAKGLQYTLHFYDANKCGKRTGRLEWRADCHMEDEHIPLKQYGEDFKGINLPDTWIQEHLAELDPDGDGCLDCEGGMHDAGETDEEEKMRDRFRIAGSDVAGRVEERDRKAGFAE